MFNTKVRFRAIVCTAAILLGAFSVLSLGQETPKANAQVQPNAQKATHVQTEIGVAKYYDGAPKGKKRELTAAHKYLKRGTIVRVESLEGGNFKTIEVEITDRLPDTKASRGTVIDLARKSAIAMNPAFVRKGVLKVKLTIIK